MGFYFDRIYNPVYDFIVAQIAPYSRLQSDCIEKLGLRDGDRLLCAGVGTGNEITRILGRHPGVRITGVDSSPSALRKARRKARKMGASIDTRMLDIRKLDFPESSFDKLLCIHVTDFVPDSARASAEMVRVLKPGGRFTITFPSGKEDVSWGFRIVAEAVRDHWRNHRYHKLPLVGLSFAVGAIVYLPFLFRRARREYRRDDIHGIFAPLASSFSISEFSVYNDYIVSGCKQ